jgi:hypothetical protein
MVYGTKLGLDVNVLEKHLMLLERSGDSRTVEDHSLDLRCLDCRSAPECLTMVQLTDCPPVVCKCALRRRVRFVYHLLGCDSNWCCHNGNATGVHTHKVSPW